MFLCKFSDRVAPTINDARNDIFVASRIKAGTFSTDKEKEETRKYRKKFPETEGLHCFRELIVHLFDACLKVAQLLF